MTKRRVVVVRRKKTKAVRQFPRPNLPEKPKVTVGAKCYGRSKKGGYIVPRFWITQWRAGAYTRSPKKSDPWFVIDMEETKQYVASGTKASGYEDKQKAIRVARALRDEFGAWYVMPF